jgi:putative transposase
MAAIVNYNAAQDADGEVRQVQYLNNIVEQGHRAITRLVRPLLGFKAFRSAAIALAGIEIMNMIRKDQLSKTGKLRPVKQFYSLAGEKPDRLPEPESHQPGKFETEPDNLT